MARTLMEMSDEQFQGPGPSDRSRAFGSSKSSTSSPKIGRSVAARQTQGVHHRAHCASDRQDHGAAWAIAHAMMFYPGSLPVIACPAQRQSAEALRRVKDALVTIGTKLKVELENGAQVLTLPSSDDSIRGLTVDAALDFRRI
jgi:hypothetical protein